LFDTVKQAAVVKEQTMNTTITALPAQRAHELASGVRVGDREREKVITRLGQAFAQGYLSVPEYEGRLDRALEAHTAGALNETLGDLPIKRIARTDPLRRAAKIAAARRGVRIHLAAYLAASLLIVGIWLGLAVTVGAWYVWPIWPILGGAVGVVSHGVAVRAAAAGLSNAERRRCPGVHQQGKGDRISAASHHDHPAAIDRQAYVDTEESESRKFAD
jgi:hypothetical protein